MPGTLRESHLRNEVDTLGASSVILFLNSFLTLYSTHTRHSQGRNVRLKSLCSECYVFQNSKHHGEIPCKIKVKFNKIRGLILYEYYILKEGTLPSRIKPECPICCPVKKLNLREKLLQHQ